MGRPRKQYPVVARLPRWSAREWDAWRRGVESGQAIGRQEGHDEAAASRPRTDRILREREVRQLTGLARTTRWNWARRGLFPAPVPLVAMSGGTLIALAADEIVMSPHAVLGPVDPQLGEYPAASLPKVVAKKPIGEIDDKTLVFADVGEKAMNQLRAAVKDLLARTQPAEKAEELAGLLATGTWTHDYPITFEEARRLGLRVRSDVPRDVMRLMTLFPQPVRRQPSVEFAPGPRRAEDTKRRSASAAG